MVTTKESAGRSECDAIVVGAGVIGLACGWRLARRGASVLVLDAGEPARGATHVAAGMLAPVNEAHFGEEELLRLNLEAARSYPTFVSELERETGAQVGYRASGTLAVALDRDQAEVLRQLHRFHATLGLDAEWLSGRECRRLEPGLAPRVLGGFRSPVDHQVNPRALARALEVGVRVTGGALHGGCRARSLVVAGDRVTGVELDDGEHVRAPHVVVAAGWRSGELTGLPPRASVPVRPVKGQILRLRGSAPVIERVVRTPEVYLVPRDGGELVVGATVEERGSDTTVTAGGVLELLRSAYEAVPGVIELELVEAAAGLRPAGPDNKPIVGAGALEGLVWATGHWRNGVLLAPLTADAVAELVAGGRLPELFAPFTPDRFTHSVADEAAPEEAAPEEAAPEEAAPEEAREPVAPPAGAEAG
jgi:glycine oxidase